MTIKQKDLAALLETWRLEIEQLLADRVAGGRLLMPGQKIRFTMEVVEESPVAGIVIPPVSEDKPSFPGDSRYDFADGETSLNTFKLEARDWAALATLQWDDWQRNLLNLFREDGNGPFHKNTISRLCGIFFDHNSTRAMTRVLTAAGKMKPAATTDQALRSVGYHFKAIAGKGGGWYAFSKREVYKNPA